LKSKKIMSVFLLGGEQSFIGADELKQDAKSNEIVERLGLDKHLKFLIRKNEDLFSINICDVDGFVLFPYCFEWFPPLIYLADTRLPVIVYAEEETFGNALDTYEYLRDRDNVHIVFTAEELTDKIRAMENVRLFENVKVCLFDAGLWTLNKIAYLKNALFQGKLNIHLVDMAKFLETYQNIDEEKAVTLAQKWMSEALQVAGPFFEDIVKSARIYLAMKAVILDMGANAAYALWCGQFTKNLGTKMCFALAKLADDGIPVGCWRGENLLPLLILHSIAKKPVFVCEAHTKKGKTITLRHCFAPTTIANRKYVLRRWRNMEGTVTGYCQLPKGEVTLVNCGVGDKLVVVTGKVTECKDLEGDNCRMTIWVELENAELIRKFVGREFAMIYGDYAKETREIGAKLGLKVL